MKTTKPQVEALERMVAPVSGVGEGEGEGSGAASGSGRRAGGDGGGGRSGGRGARERILKAAGQLFYERGIHATGVAALVEAAHVSTRTFYQQFESKNALVEEYLRQFETGGALESERQLGREDLTPAERLLAIFDPLAAMLALPVAVRGCPFHNAAVEAAGCMPEVARFVEQHKRGFLERLTAAATEAGVVDAGGLARQLAVVYEGANALAATCNDTRVIDDARAAAATLIESALGGRV